MAKPYFTLVYNEGSHLSEPWGIAFGDYDQEVVEQERDDLADSWDAPKKAFKIIRTNSAKQAEIDAAVAKLNGAEPTPDYEA